MNVHGDSEAAAQSASRATPLRQSALARMRSGRHMGGQNTRMPNGTVARLIYFAFFLKMTGREKSKPSSAMRGGGGGTGLARSTIATAA